jgi:hypothetical protein
VQIGSNNLPKVQRDIVAAGSVRANNRYIL